MKIMKLSEICQVLNLQTNDDCLIKHISNDINDLRNDSLIFHLNKDNEFNPYQFKNVSNCYIITDQPLLTSYDVDESKFFFVLDVQKAYQTFINYYRNLFNIPIVAITGTCGKTTTKEMVKQILENDHHVVATIGNRNSLSFDHEYLFSFDDNTEYGVFETAITNPGNLIYGCNYFKPSIGVITNIGIDHLSGCRTLDNYIRTKGELLAGLNYQGILIINNDDENIKKINFNPFRGKIVTYGINNQSDFYGTDIIFNDLTMEFTLHYQDKKYVVQVPGLGIHNIYNALAALAALTMLGIDLQKAINLMPKVKFIRSHVEVKKGYNNSTIIDDTWSSNPTSVKAALEVLHEKAKDKISIAVLGRIAYLGNFAEHYYEEIGKMIVDKKINFLITTDSYAKHIAKSAIENGMEKEFHIHCPENEQLRATLQSLMDENTIVLFKTSMLDSSINGVIRQLIEE